MDTLQKIHTHKGEFDGSVAQRSVKVLPISHGLRAGFPAVGQLHTTGVPTAHPHSRPFVIALVPTGAESDDLLVMIFVRQR